MSIYLEDEHLISNPTGMGEYCLHFMDSDKPKNKIIEGELFFKIIGKMIRKYDYGDRVVLLLQLDVFYAPDVRQLVYLTDEKGTRIIIPDCNGYRPHFGLKAPWWGIFACSVEATNIERIDMIGDYVRVLRPNEVESADN